MDAGTAQVHAWRATSATLPLENPDRHAEGGDSERPPRPIGIATGTAWEPRNPIRSYAKNQATVRFLEALEAVPWLQDIAVAAYGLLSPLYTRGDAPAPEDVPDPAGAWTFAAIGDYGAGTPQLARVAGNLARSSAELVVTTGDNVYPSGRWEDYARNWTPWMAPIAQSRPFMPALGNHDMYRDDLRPYFGHFPHLQGRAYYTFTHRNAQFFALDSDQDLRVGSAQYRWLEDALRRAKGTWKIVYLHYPLYGADSMEQFGEIREALQPLLARYGVQLVLAGHEHHYARSQAIDGVTHLLTGGGGQRVYPFLFAQPDHLARRKAAYHHVEIAVGATQLVVRAIDEHGRRIDTAVIPAGNGASAQAKAGARALRRR